MRIPKLPAGFPPGSYVDRTSMEPIHREGMALVRVPENEETTDPGDRERAEDRARKELLLALARRAAVRQLGAQYVSHGNWHAAMQNADRYQDAAARIGVWIDDDEASYLDPEPPNADRSMPFSGLVVGRRLIPHHRTALFLFIWRDDGSIVSMLHTKDVPNWELVKVTATSVRKVGNFNPNPEV